MDPFGDQLGVDPLLLSTARRNSNGRWYRLVQTPSLGILNAPAYKRLAHFGETVGISDVRPLVFRVIVNGLGLAPLPIRSGSSNKLAHGNKRRWYLHVLPLNGSPKTWVAMMVTLNHQFLKLPLSYEAYVEGTLYGHQMNWGQLARDWLSRQLAIRYSTHSYATIAAPTNGCAESFENWMLMSENWMLMSGSYASQLAGHPEQASGLIRKEGKSDVVGLTENCGSSVLRCMPSFGFGMRHQSDGQIGPHAGETQI
jgi:hypothetical protein